jgi:hypothetical protein
MSSHETLGPADKASPTSLAHAALPHALPSQHLGTGDRNAAVEGPSAMAAFLPARIARNHSTAH